MQFLLGHLAIPRITSGMCALSFRLTLNPLTMFIVASGEMRAIIFIFSPFSSLFSIFIMSFFPRVLLSMFTNIITGSCGFSNPSILSNWGAWPAFMWSMTVPFSIFLALRSLILSSPQPFPYWPNHPEGSACLPCEKVDQRKSSFHHHLKEGHADWNPAGCLLEVFCLLKRVDFRGDFIHSRKRM